MPGRISIKLRFPEIEIKVIYFEVQNTPHMSIELTKESDDGMQLHKRTVYDSDLETIESIRSGVRPPGKFSLKDFSGPKLKFNTCTITLSNPH